MKIKKLLKIVLVAPSYLVVSDKGENRTVHCDTFGYSIGDIYELEEESLEVKSKPQFSPIKKNKYKFLNDEKKEEGG